MIDLQRSHVLETATPAFTAEESSDHFAPLLGRFHSFLNTELH
jgi:hypothetical protein